MGLKIAELSNSTGKKLGKAFSASVANQAISSGSNFLLGFYLVRVLTSSEFGLYGIGFAVCMFFVGAGNAVFLTQMVVHLPDKEANERLPYVKIMFGITSLFSIATFASVNIIVLVLSFYVEWAQLNGEFWCAVSTASAAYLLKDFFIRYNFNKKLEGEALLINVVLATTTLSTLLLLYFATIAMSATLALYVYAFGHLVAICFSYWRSEVCFSKAGIIAIREVLAESWHHGRWALFQNLVYWLRTQSYTYVCLLFIGVHAVGLINAARILVCPILFVLPAVSQIMLPRLASMREDQQRVTRVTKLVAVLLFIAALVYSLLIVLNLDTAIPAALGKQYLHNKDVPALVVVWCGITCIQVVQTCFGSLSQALKLFREWAFANLAGALIAIALAGMLCIPFGVTGAVFGTFAGELVLLLIMLRQCTRDCRSQRITKGDGQASCTSKV